MSLLKNIEHKPVTLWLLLCAFMVFAMTVIGAITRLTESGLSMVEWRPLIGALPPMNETEWERVFTLYQQSPQYQKVNGWMDMEAFKSIFFWEWFHRFWGRMIGLVFALPLLFFWVRKMIPEGYKLKLFGMLILGGMQGVMGWYMVKSGLVDVPAVSHYRLAAHLSLALLIFALLIWLGASIGGAKKTPDKTFYWHSVFAALTLTLTIFWGAFTAGLDAGLLYNESFPKMGGSWLPLDLKNAEGGWQNFLEMPSGVQFTHRWLAVVTALNIIALCVHGIMRGKAFNALYALGFMVVVQFGLGLATLFSGVHIHAAATHQAGAVILLGLLVICIRRVRS